MIALFLAGAALAAPHRYALVVGANHGDAGEVPLRYAEEDALRVASVLTRLGGVDPADLVLLRTPDANTLQAALIKLASRIAAESTVADAELFVYYSGHADASDLHLAGTRVSLVGLRTSVGAVRAGTRLILLDACRAGELTRRKGGAPAAPFQITAEDRLTTDGLAIVTSAAAGEDAQESDFLGGGVFTHHLVAGMEGAADVSGDARVTLTEGYQYAYARTVATTSGAPTLQHPSFAWDLAGRSDLVLTRLDDPSRSAWIKVAVAGEYLVLDARGQVLVREATLGVGGLLALPPGHYRLRLRTPARLYESEIAPSAGTVLSVASDALVPVPLGQATRRGGQAPGAGPLALALEAGGGARGPLGSGMEWGPAASIGARMETAAVTLRARATFDRSDAQNGDLSLVQTGWGADLTVAKLGDVGPISAGAGLVVGARWMTQVFETTGEAPDRSALAGTLGPIGRVDVSLGPRLFLGVEGGFDAVLAPYVEPGIAARVVPHAELQVGAWLR